jgi:hypothetical protein
MASENLQWNHPGRREEEREPYPKESRSLRARDNATTPPKVDTPTCDAGFWTIADPPPAYCFSPLRDGYIRLLRLMPHQDKHAPIQCQLFDYPLLDSGKGTHLYEALSYFWGPKEKPRRVFANKGYLHVTENLHAALSRLRDYYLQRIIWVNAIYIN